LNFRDRIRVSLKIPLLIAALFFLSPARFASPSDEELQVLQDVALLEAEVYPEPAVLLPPEPEPDPDWVAEQEALREALRQEMVSKIRAVLNRPQYRNTEWGIDIYSIEEDRRVFALNENSFFSPASNVKVFTTATALDRLGRNFRFKTRLLYTGRLDPDGVLVGDLILVGNGDPNLSNSISGDPNVYAHLDLLAEEVKKAGIRSIRGDVIGDDSYFAYAPYGRGWLTSDLSRVYGAQVSALSFYNNVLAVTARPAKVGQRATVFSYPARSMFAITNRSTTVAVQAKNTFGWSHTPGSNEIRVFGQMPVNQKGIVRYFNVADPALYTATILKERLQKAGVAISGKTRSRHSGEPPLPLMHPIYTHESIPLADVVAFINKKSQNLSAEILLRTLGAEIKGIGTDQAGLDVVEEFLQRAGVETSMVNLYDGSGLSRNNLITPQAETALLRYMATRPSFPDFMSSFPVSAYDGTLRGRMHRSSAAGRVFGKTGSLKNVATLGGYIKTDSGQTLAFSIMANNAVETGAARQATDRICEILIGY
jgi:serine-type D-Ala-D-Ala carboxypeptidase/endopeptidase (penicillin-binding protein 4)